MTKNAGKLFGHLRKSKGISQSQMAERLHMSQRKLSRIETGEIAFEVADLIVGFMFLNINVDDLWMIYLDYDEFVGYQHYQKIRKFLKDGTISEIPNVLPFLKAHPEFWVFHQRNVPPSIRG